MRTIRWYFVKLMKQKNNKKILGRWLLEQCEKKKEYQIYLANKDYGNPEGFYNIEKEEEQYDIDTEIRMRYMV